MWVRGFYYSLPVFKAHTLVGWPFSGLLCKMWRQWQPFAASSSPHRVWPALQCSPSHVSFLLFSLIRCQTLHRYSHTLQEVGVKGFYFFLNSGFSFFFLHSFQLNTTHYSLVQTLLRRDANCHSYIYLDNFFFSLGRNYMFICQCPVIYSLVRLQNTLFILHLA